jgi:tetratricopeptide (TPR) repeat protein
VEDLVWVKGIRLRAAREAAGLRLVDATKGIMSPANLSRIERHERYKLPRSAVLALAARLGLVLNDTADLQAWTREVGQTAIDLLRRWRFSNALLVLRSRDAVLAPPDQTAEVQAQILGEWAQLQCHQAGRPDVIRDLGRRARECGAVRQSIWASAIEAEMHGHAGDPAFALQLLTNASKEAEKIGEVTDVLSIRAASGRLFLKAGEPAHGLEILGEVKDLIDSASDYSQARYLHAQGMLWFASGRPEEAAQGLRAAIQAALRIPNHRMAGTVECALANAYESMGDTDQADAALVRAASSFTQAGDSHDAAGAISLALHHHISPPRTIRP